MALDFTSSTGNIFNALGARLGVFRSALLFSGDTNITEIDSLADAVALVQSQHVSTHPSLIDGLYTNLESWRSSVNAVVQAAANDVRAALVYYVDQDATLPAVNEAEALLELDRQMKDGSDSVDANAVSVSYAAHADNTGDAMVVVSLDRTDGRDSEYVFPEDIEVRCTNDENNDSSLTAVEPFSFRGEATKEFFAWDWPGGSGSSGERTAIDAATDADSATTLTNLCNNSDFESQTSNVPDDWNLRVGSAGTNLLTETSTVYKGTRSIEFVGDAGGTLTAIDQQFGTDTTGDLLPNTVYHFACRVRKSASLAAGTLALGFTSATTATYIDDDQGADIVATIAHGSVSSSAWTIFRGSLVTPDVLPANRYLRLGLSVALTNGESLFVDHLSLVNAGDAAYNGGYRITVHSGATDAVIGDRYTITIANGQEGAIQTYFWRIFPELVANGLQLRSNSAGSETIADTLIPNVT